MENKGSIYDERYRQGYRARLNGYEVARRQALKHFISRVVKPGGVGNTLDYGSGNGLFLDLWLELFPKSRICCADISPVALEQLRENYKGPDVSTGLVENGKAPFPNGMFDIVVSVEVLEHVENLDDYLDDIYRLLKPGGFFIWTTPCANAFSIEHIYSGLTGKIEATGEGYRRWQWEEKTHLRRLKSREARALLQKRGYGETGFRYRAHFFSFFCTYVLTPLFRRRLTRVWEKMMLLDYALFRRFANGASMIGYARKQKIKEEK